MILIYLFAALGFIETIGILYVLYVVYIKKDTLIHKDSLNEEIKTKLKKSK